MTEAQRPDSALDGVRLHRDRRADDLTAALGATAVTAGRNIYFSAGAPGLSTTAGRRLLAHELTHVAQQQRFGPRLQFFTAAEKPQIAPNLGAMMAVIAAIVAASSDGSRVNMDTLVRLAGGQTAMAALPKAIRSAEPPVGSMLSLRYLFTRRAGLIDMRHFLQLMYISWFTNTGSADMAARGATRRGVEHEEKAEATSRYAPEDLTSNALGAFTATRLAGIPQRDDLIATIRATLERSGPVDFGGLSPKSQTDLVQFYSARSATGEPLNQNRTAVALIPHIPELAGTDRSFPFSLDEDDPRRATIGGPAFDRGAAGLTGDSEIREFVDVQRDEVIQAILPAEMARLGTRLLSGWVSDADIDAFEKLYRLAGPAGREALRAVASANLPSGHGQRARLRRLS
ncbi:DUF4157 domain-containing protein [Amycolatopsis anabasis]|uniref:eCIS core domain-containing protein n=1 Tax=Amycolatopsis anabasis TaxID=1840409 RepID=UPI001C551E9B|nr:DUF4157 domain-containing protein [Amycolatopsis anabasis]